MSIEIVFIEIVFIEIVFIEIIESKPWRP